MPYKAAFRVWRGDAGSGELADYQVEVNEGEVVLDVLHRLQATQASDLAIRWNCKAGKCGSCSMEINGRPRLGCMTRMSTFSPDEDRKSTRLNSSHPSISYAVFCLKKKKINSYCKVLPYLSGCVL